MKKIYEGPKKLKQWARGQEVETGSVGDFDNYQLYEGVKEMKNWVGVDGIASGSGLPDMPAGLVPLKVGDSIGESISFDTSLNLDEYLMGLENETLLGECELTFQGMSNELPLLVVVEALDVVGNDGNSVKFLMNEFALASSNDNELIVYVTNNATDEALTAIANEMANEFDFGEITLKRGWNVESVSAITDAIISKFGEVSAVVTSVPEIDFIFNKAPEKMIIMGNPHEGTAGWVGYSEPEAPASVDIVEISVDNVYADSFEFNVSMSNFERLKAPNAILRLRSGKSSPISVDEYLDFHRTFYQALGDGAMCLMNFIAYECSMAIDTETQPVIKGATITYVSGVSGSPKGGVEVLVDVNEANGKIRTYEYETSSTNTTITIDPNKRNAITDKVGTVNIVFSKGLVAPQNYLGAPRYDYKYQFFLSTGDTVPTVTFSPEIILPADFAFEANKTYSFSLFGHGVTVN